VVVIGGGSAGCEIAYELTDQKRSVTISEQLPELATDLFSANRDMLLELLKVKGAHIMTNCQIEKVIPGIVIYQLLDGIRGEVKTDSIVLAIGRRSVNTLLPQINELVNEVHVIGDCIASRKVIDAMWEAYKKAIKV